MQSFRTIALWKKAPFLRLFIPFATGIIWQWYFPTGAGISYFVLSFLLIILILQSFLPLSFRFRHYLLTGFILNCFLFFYGILVTHYKYSPNDSDWIGHHYQQNAIVIARIEEPLSEKARSYKAIASVNRLIVDGQCIPVRSRIILYFQKDSLAGIADSNSTISLQYGSELMLSQTLQPISNSGNPGGFDYKRYASFQDIYYQDFLKPGKWKILPINRGHWFNRFLFSTREKIIALLRTHISGEVECGLAEALLIGYKDDLDKQLVQAYSNTGVVHVIAISGLHLGLIYWLLASLLQPFSIRKKTKWIKPLVILAGLWLFSLLAGGSPSVLRSAVMFSCIALGECSAKKISVYNSLAASAFLLLCYNPFWLWDAGFQLSYIAVLSIVIFNKPIYDLLYIADKRADHVWKLVSVTLAAQILTTPVSIYYFHQFPLVFLITNLLAIPLSSVVLLGELLLCCVAFIPIVASGIGWVLFQLIRVLNYFVTSIDHFPFAVWGNLSLSFTQIILLYGALTGLACWLMLKNRKAFPFALICLLIFLLLRSASFAEAITQRKLIVYNVPRFRAIDFIDGRDYVFNGDSVLLHDEFSQNFHLRPSRQLHRIKQVDNLQLLLGDKNFFVCGTTRILIVDKKFRLPALRQKIRVDIVVISGNPKLYINRLLAVIDCGQIVIDSSNSPWRGAKWQSDCSDAGIACHNVNTTGAFVMNLP